MTLITEEYRKLNAELHQTDPNWGNGKKASFNNLIKLFEKIETPDVLDYGCGKALKWKELDLPYKPKLYDPAIPEYSFKPEPADYVICLDVLEHIEPECLDDVIKDLYRVVKQVGIFQISLRLAKVILSDGRNAHLSLHTPEEWKRKLRRYFDIQQEHLWKNDSDLILVVIPRINLLEMGPTEEVFAPMDGEPVDLMNYKMVEFGDYQPINFFPAYQAYALARIDNWFSPDPDVEIKEERIAIVGYGPSLRDTWEMTKEYKTIFTCSGSHKFLLERGIVPTYHVEIDWKPHKPEFTRITHPDTTYLLSSVCNAGTIDNVKDRKSKLFFINHGPLVIHPLDAYVIEPGYDVGQQALTIALQMGYRNFDLFGFDYCFDIEKIRHAGDHGGRVHCAFPAKVGDKVFYTSKTMFAALLVMEYFCERHPEMDLRCYSDTLLVNFFEERVRLHEITEQSNHIQTGVVSEEQDKNISSA
jgi:uncharacterized Rossmann fold enzyme